MPQSETQLQAECFQWCWNEHPETRRLLWMNRNHGKKKMMEALQDRAMGLVPGIPDLTFIWKFEVYGIEIKIPGGVLSDDQKKVHKAWGPHGNIITVYSLEQFKNHINTVLSN